MTKAVCDGVAGLTAEERVVLAVEAVEREVNNGGYEPALHRRIEALAPYFVDSLEAVGAGEAERLTRRAIDALGSKDRSRLTRSTGRWNEKAKSATTPLRMRRSLLRTRRRSGRSSLRLHQGQSAPGSRSAHSGG